jgi:hypothetical protein
VKRTQIQLNELSQFNLILYSHSDMRGMYVLLIDSYDHLIFAIFWQPILNRGYRYRYFLAIC